MNKQEQYCKRVVEFQKRWWRAINARAPQTVSEAALEAAREAVVGFPTSVMQVDVGLQWMAGASIEPAERVAELRVWFDGLGIAPHGVVVVADFGSALTDLGAARAAVERGLAARRVIA